MLDKQEELKAELDKYKKKKSKWSNVNTALIAVGASLTCVLAVATGVTAGMSVPIVAGIIGGVTAGNALFSSLLIKGFTLQHLKYFRRKCKHISEYLFKMEVYFIKCMEDKEISIEEFEGFQKLLEEYENTIPVKSDNSTRMRSVQKTE